MLREDWTLVNLDFSRDDYEGPPITDLLQILDHVRPTALVGLSTIGVRLLLY